MSQAGSSKPKIAERVAQLALTDFDYRPCPVVFWDVFGSQGLPARTTVSEMGPLLMARMLDLNATQQGVLTAVFKIADDAGLLLLDLKDLRAMLAFAADNAQQFKTRYGNISAASVGAIQRGLLELEQQGGEVFFGEPALDIADLMGIAPDGRGVVNILAADKLINAPKVYGAFLLWLLSELFENLPEVGDPDKPRLVFFFDEAHLLFDDAPQALQDKIEQLVRLIRSKGVGVYFVTQNPLDIPEAVLGQLGNRVQHALRAFTPRDEKAVRTAASTLRRNPRLDVEQAITELGVGEALVSLLDEKGRPCIVERALIAPPGSRIGPASEQERAAVIAASALGARYRQTVDRESAYEKLNARAADAAVEAKAEPEQEGPSLLEQLGGIFNGGKARSGGRSREGVLEAAAKSAARAMGSEMGRQILRGLLGSFLGGRRRR
jgi:DNA helicase HerA-like ATPase